MENNPPGLQASRSDESKNNAKGHKLLRTLPVIILAAGIFLRSYQYLMGRSLWEDETHLALNIMKYDFAGLTRPLDFIQAAPVLFLWLVKCCALIFGYGEAALRFIPFAASVLSLPLFYFILLDLTANRAAAIAGFLLFSVNITFIYFSSELKPYALDVAFYILLVFLMTSQHSIITARRNMWLAVAGSAGIFLSVSIFIVLFCCGCVIAFRWLKTRRIDMTELCLLLFWTCAFQFNYFLFIHNHPSAAQQQHNYASAFCPNMLSPEFFPFLEKIANESLFTLNLRFTANPASLVILLTLFALALIRMYRLRDLPLIAFTLLPVLVHLLLSGRDIYPFAHRLVLYLAPALIVLISAGMAAASEMLFHRSGTRLTTAICLCISLFLTAPSLTAFPSWNREIRPALDFMNDSIGKAHVYVFDPINAVTYYEKRGYTSKPVYRALPWTLSPPEFYRMTAGEKNDYLIIYNSYDRWEYGGVIEDLRQRGLLKKNFSARGYEVGIVSPSDSIEHALTIDHTFFDPAIAFGGEKYIPLWSESPVRSIPFDLPAGSYDISFYTYGTSAAGAFPVTRVFLNEMLAGTFESRQPPGITTLRYEHKEDKQVILSMNLANDTEGNGEDRNAFVLYARFIPHQN